MNSRGELELGDVFRTPGTEDLWYVDYVSGSGVHCIPLSAHPTPITTNSKRTGKPSVTKFVNRHQRITVFSLTSAVELVDLARLDPAALRKRLNMARKNEAPAEGSTEGGTAVAERPPVERIVQKYTRTDKEAPKEMRGQGKIVFDALAKADGPRSATELAKEIGSFEGSRQDPERVVGFYLSKFKREGLVKVADAPPSA